MTLLGVGNNAVVNLGVHFLLEVHYVFSHDFIIKTVYIDSFPQSFLDSRRLLLDLLIQFIYVTFQLAHFGSKTFNLLKFFSWTSLRDLEEYLLYFKVVILEDSDLGFQLGVFIYKLCQLFTVLNSMYLTK